MIKSLLFNSPLSMFISFLYISSLDLSDKMYLFLSSSFLIRSSISLVIVFKMIAFYLLSFAISKTLSIKNSDSTLSWLLMLASCTFLGVFIKFICVDKLGVVSKSLNCFQYRESYWVENFTFLESYLQLTYQWYLRSRKMSLCSDLSYLLVC